MKVNPPPTILLEPLVDRAELARRLGVTTSCVEKWQARRRISCYRFGRRCVRFDFQETLKVLATFKTPAWQRFKKRKNPLLLPPSELVQIELPFRDPRQLELPGLEG